MKVFLYVQHLLGVGHLKRASVIARALARAGCEVTVASGGAAVPGFFSAEIRLLQLPPASSDAGFRTLLDERGQEVDEGWKARRRQRLLSAFEEVKPDCLLIELFPFGRRQMRFELVPLLEAASAAKPRPLIACSVRDLLRSPPSSASSTASSSMATRALRPSISPSPAPASWRESCGTPATWCRTLPRKARPGPAR
jgi:predicted glycosyltransferase